LTSHYLKSIKSNSSTRIKKSETKGNGGSVLVKILRGIKKRAVKKRVMA